MCFNTNLHLSAFEVHQWNSPKSQISTSAFLFLSLFRAPLWKSGAILDLPCSSIILSIIPSVIPSVPHSFLLSSYEINFLYTFLKNCKGYKLKLGTHIPSGLVYCVYWNQGQGPITLGVTSLDRFYNLPLMKNFSYRFLRNYESCKVETWYKLGQWADVSCLPESGARAHNSWRYSLW